MDALGGRPDRKRPAFDPPPHDRRQPADIDVTTRGMPRSVRGLERLEALPDELPPLHGTAGRLLGLDGRRVALQERSERRKLVRERPRLQQRPQLVDQREQAAQGGERRVADPRRRAPLFGVLRERLRPAGEPYVRQRPIESPNRAGAGRRSVHVEPEVRRPQQLHRRSLPEATPHQREDEVDGRRVRLDRERQSVAGTHRKRGLVEHGRREVEIRQRTLHHHRGGRGRAPVDRNRALHLARNPAQLVFAVAPYEVRLVRRRIGNDDTGRPAGVRLDARLGEAGQHVVEPLPIPAIEHCVGRDHGDPRQPRKSRQQIEVRGVQTRRVRGLVRHGHDDLRDRLGRFRNEQPFPQPMLVHAAKGVQPAVVGAERRDQEAGLQQETPGSTIEVGARLELLDEEPLERVHRTLVAPELIVERQQRRDDARAQSERRRTAGGQRVAGRRTTDDLPLNRRQQRRTGVVPLAQPLVPLAPRHQRRPPAVDARRGERTPQLAGRRPGRCQHRHRRRRHPGAPGNRLRDRPLERTECRRAQQACLPRRDRGSTPH